jgi:hypothetical protein
MFSATRTVRDTASGRVSAIDQADPERRGAQTSEIYRREGAAEATTDDGNVLDVRPDHGLKFKKAVSNASGLGRT